MHNRLAILLLYLLSTLMFKGLAQEIPEHISDDHIYSFIDELANEGLIELNSVVKPYSRQYIAGKLQEAAGKPGSMSQVQQKTLQMLLKDYAPETDNNFRAGLNLTRDTSRVQVSLLPPVFSYRDGLFRAYLKPVYGVRFISNSNGNVRHTHGGLSAGAYIGKHWAVWASLRDNYQTNEILAMPSYLTPEEGGNYKIGVQGRSGGDYSEMRAGIAWSWQWGSLSFSKDHVEWGDNYHGANIFSGKAPSAAMLKLNLDPVKWFSFTYFHSWLVSEVIDSSRSYFSQPGMYRAVFRDKYLAANMFTFRPMKRLMVSAGNSIIYSDTKVQPAYLIPFMFFKSVDHTLSHNIDNQNSQMFVNISSRQIRHLHLFTTVFVDEFSVSRIGDPNRTNFTGFKAGFRLSGWPLKNVSLTAEATRSNPMIYRHRVETLTFESNGFNMGHYLRDNSRELYVALQWRPLAGLLTGVSWVRAEHGNQYQYDLNGTIAVDEYPYMQDVIWRNTTLGFHGSYHLWNNLSLYGSFSLSDIQGFDADGVSAQVTLNRYTPALLQGSTNTLTIGFQMGF